MIQFRVSEAARQAVQSPSVALEKGAYRMRAPPRRDPSIRRLSNARPMDRSNAWMALLVVVLASATVTSFAAAYYLFTTRWDMKAIKHIRYPQANEKIQVLNIKNEATARIHDPHERFLSYLPHSGFHNQRIAFENALVLARLLNRTLLVPPVRLGNKPLRYVKYENLKRFVSLSDKQGLYHCPSAPVNITPTECTDYFDYTHVPWDWLVELAGVKENQPLLQRWDMTDDWIRDQLQITQDDTLLLQDNSPYDFRFIDTTEFSRSKYLETIYIPDLALSSKRLVQIGTLFGSSRLHLRTAENISIRKFVRQNMVFSNRYLTHAANAVADALGGSYIGVHVRLGDGRFKEDGESNVRLIWWKLVHQILQYDRDQTLALERRFEKSISHDLHPPRDLPILRAPRPPMPEGNPAQFSCDRPRHLSARHQALNTPIFISTDISSPRSNPSISIFLETFPCVFFLSDFPSQQSKINKLQSNLDGVMLREFLQPFLDAMVVSRAHAVVGTDGSTFSRFVEDVLWTRHHGLDIVQKG
jgi:hypothetical protein